MDSICIRLEKALTETPICSHFSRSGSFRETHGNISCVTCMDLHATNVSVDVHDNETDSDHGTPTFGPETAQFHPRSKWSNVGSETDASLATPSINLAQIAENSVDLKAGTDTRSSPPQARNTSMSVISKESRISPMTTLKAFSLNANFVISIFIFFLCFFMAFISILYGFGQITQLQLSNYWCEKKDSNAIYQHSYKYGLNQGTNDGCWKSKQFTVCLSICVS